MIQHTRPKLCLCLLDVVYILLLNPPYLVSFVKMDNILGQAFALSTIETNYFSAYLLLSAPICYVDNVPKVATPSFQPTKAFLSNIKTKAGQSSADPRDLHLSQPLRPKYCMVSLFYFFKHVHCTSQQIYHHTINIMQSDSVGSNQSFSPISI